MNIEEAITAGTSTTPPSKCRLGRWLTDIPTDTPGRGQLLAIVEEANRYSPNWRTLEQIDAILRRLGFTTSNKTVANHRNQVCRCFQ